MRNHQRINADSGVDEYYTPIEIINAARDVMGGVIDLDPASSLIANEIIKARNIFTLLDDGLNQDWNGKVWMNHPFGRSTNRHWIKKLSSEFDSGRTTEAVCITFASTSERWFAPLLKHPQCFLSPRTNYFMPDGTLKRGVTKGSVITYFGNNLESFIAEFRKFGAIKIAV